MKRVGAALLASAVAHATAAAAIGGVLVAATRPTPAAAAQETLEIDLAPIENEPGSAPAARAMPGPVAPARAPVVRRLAAAARPTARPLSAPAVSTALAAAPSDDTAPARFALSAATVASGPGLFNAAEAPAGTSATSGATSIFGAGEVDAPARLLAASPVSYPPAARQAEIETDVPLEIVVDPAGHVVSARLTSKAGFGLDDEALRAIRGYRFSPALRAGQAVAVRMRWLVQFRLQ